jgi:hypothetical protein
VGEKRGAPKPPPTKKAETKRGAEAPAVVAPPEIDQSLLDEVGGEGTVLTEAQIEVLMPGVADTSDDKQCRGTLRPHNPPSTRHKDE